LTGGAIPERKLFWHFPHYTNQGSRPSGAMREGEWLLVELYDEDKVELYNLSTDVGEMHDIANRHLGRVSSMRAALDTWRKGNTVQYNVPNPNYDEEQFRRLYVDVDPSRFDPLLADDEAWTRISAWRERMDEVYRRGQE
jgi:hypothetical protein